MSVTFTGASSAALSLTESSPRPSRKYDVFLSFRGPDVRKGFLSHLYKALTDNGIHTFRDDTQLQRGSYISPALLEAIEDSRFAVVVISENYATSTWCLRELVHITDCIDKKRLELMIPIFFGVDPSHVKNLTGNFAKAFAEHDKLPPDHTETVETWRKAMAKVGLISGWDSRNWNEESKLIDELVQDLIDRLFSPGELLGMSTHMSIIYPLMSVDPNGVRMVGICGMRGIGKTTIAKHVYTVFFSTFDGASLIENVKRDFNQYGPSHLRNKILSEIFCNQGRDSDEMKERLRGKKILLVLDDVDDIQQLRELAGKPEWFGPGSRIIITTRDRRVLDLHDVERIYEVMPLRKAQALELFSRHDFKKLRPCDYYREVVTDVVQQLYLMPFRPNFSDASPRQEKSIIVREPEMMVFSLIELFTPEQVREHIRGLRQWVIQSKVKAERNLAMSENPCQLCAMEKLSFKAQPLYCNPCGAHIRRNAMYFTLRTDGTSLYFCIPCYNENCGETISDEGTSIPKAKLEKNINLETEESWIQCDKCQAWQHQICALFNGLKDEKEKAEYTFPYCFLVEVEQNKRKPLPQSALLGAEDLPRTILSDHIEQRLFKRLKQEITERAKAQGKSIDEIPTAESLVVRVVSSVDKTLEVKPRFLEVQVQVLLFQKIEGVEVCLFGMYVQEFGTECAFPNQRRVYLSYLDFVNYFRPEVISYYGETLRTFVYHEILIGYLEYCKLRGYTSCYIWACPPPKGEDYILYCHPEIQKTPKSDELREWYLAMLRKASKEGIVAETFNLYDHFFMQTGECRAKVTASRLPYFDGDYWPGEAEDLIYKMSQEKDGKKENKKGILNKITSKRALQASGSASKDLLLMHNLGEIIYPMKEDFIMVHLQPSCTHCCILMVTGNRWVCSQCKHFQICDKCYEAEQRREDWERHPVNFKDKHALDPVAITHIPKDTWDNDAILESEFMDFRQALLYLCQGNHYQYDTLRRAKHSSMMVLYHLHNPTTPAFIMTCTVCHLDMATGQDWRCEVCPDYQVCNSCYSRHGGITHPHRLTDRLQLADDQNAQNIVARQLRVLQFKKMLDLLVHASQCRSSRCQYRNCKKVKGLFGHALQCKVCAWGGCILCKKMWHLLQVHAQACKTSKCDVPRCRDLKEQLRRSQQQTDSRRVAAVMKMMRQRVVEVARSSD